MKYRTIIITVIIAMLAFTGIGFHAMHNQADDNHEQTRTELTEAERYQHKTAHLSENQLKIHFDKSNHNLQAIEAKATQSAKNGFSIAFNDCHDKKDFNKNQSKVKALLGKQIGSDVLSVIKPTGGDNPLVNQGIADHMNSFDIAYGQYDDADDVIPMQIITSFKTPAYDPNAQMSSGPQAKLVSHKKVSQTHYLAFTGYVSPNGSLSLSNGTGNAEMQE